MKMRIILDSEWDRLVELTGGDNAKIHWRDMASWVNDPENERKCPTTHRAHRGNHSACHWSDYYAIGRNPNVGFRPAADGLILDALLSEIKEGEISVIGTLYMNGKPVKVPQNPTWDGDVTDYIPGTSLEMQEAVDDPAYQVTGIRVGEVFVADRCLLKNISYEDIKQTLRQSNIVGAV